MFGKYKIGDKVIEGIWPAFKDEYTMKNLFNRHRMVGQIRLKLATRPFVRYQYRLFHFDSYTNKYSKGVMSLWHEENNLSPLESWDPNDILKGMIK